MQYEISYKIDLEELSEFLRQVEKEDNYKSATAQAIQTGGRYLAQKWIEKAESKFKHSQGGYAQGIIEGEKYPFQNNPLHYKIEHTKDYAYYLEVGFESFDLKKMLETSTKVRVNKEGKRYLIIPFRHGTPDSKGLRAMPNEVYNKAQNLRGSVITSTYKEGVQQGAKSYQEAQMLRKYNMQKVRRNKYAWGERLKGFEGTIYEGMYRFEKNPNNVRPLNTGKFVNQSDNDLQYSNYITFRVMLEGKSGWQHPGVRAMNILKDTVEETENQILEIIQQGVEEDLKKLGFE